MKPREEKIGQIVIYKITSPTEKIYIGQTWNYSIRLDTYFKYKCKGQKLLYNSFIKYGVGNHKFEIEFLINNHSDQAELDYLEYVYWKKYKDMGIEMLNLKTPSIDKNYSMYNRNIIKRRKGSPKTEEHKQKIRQTLLGTHPSEESRKKMSISRIGKLPAIAKRVINTTTFEIFSSAREAADKYRLAHSTLKSMLNGNSTNKTNLIYYENWNNDSSNE